MSQRNIRLVYLLIFLSSFWLWLGIWIFFYLRFTDYAGVGLLETVYIVTATITSIPSGAVADLIGKKPTIIIAFLLIAAGNIFMGLSSNFMMLVLSVFLSSVGGVLLSGTVEALVFDSLKTDGREKLYDKVISNITSIELLSAAIAGSVGGYLYLSHHSYPFLAYGIMCLIAAAISFFLIEPPIDTEKFSLHSFLNQTKTGWKELTKNPAITKNTILLISIGVITVIVSEVISSLLGIEFGFSETQMGVLWAVILLASAGASQLTARLGKMLPDRKIVFLSGMILAISLILSPVVGMIVGGLILLIGACAQVVFFNFSSILINKNTRSKYRATTLSTFQMIRNIPYMISAYLIGSLAETYTAKNTALILGLILMVFLGLQYLVSKKNNFKNKLRSKNNKVTSSHSDLALKR